jgi:hypothetical protein
VATFGLLPPALPARGTLEGCYTAAVQVPRLRHRRSSLFAALAFLAAFCAPDLAAQIGPGGSPVGGAMDDHFRREAARGEGRPSRAFAFAAQVESDVTIERVDEQRQARGGPRFQLTLRNRGALTVPSVEILALVVAESGTVSAVQPMPVIKAFKRGQTKRHDVELRGVLLGQGDRLAFVISRIEWAPDDVWSAPESDLREMAAVAAQALFPRP